MSLIRFLGWAPPTEGRSGGLAQGLARDLQRCGVGLGGQAAVACVSWMFPCSHSGGGHAHISIDFAGVDDEDGWLVVSLTVKSTTTLRESIHSYVEVDV